MKEPRRTAEHAISAWKSSESLAHTEELKEALPDLIRRQVAFFLRRDGPETQIEPGAVALALTDQWGTDLDTDRKQRLAEIISSVANAVLEKEPQEVTRWLWIWDRSAPNAQEVEQHLFSAIRAELRKQLGGILHRQRFTNLHHKIDQDDLVSDLYLKLARTNIPRLPENRRQFFGLVDKAILGILLDMQKALARRPRTANNELFDVHPDERTAQDQLQVLLDSEKEVARRLELERLLSKLPQLQQEVFKLRRNGAPIAEIVEMTKVSRAQIGRHISQTKTFLAEKLSKFDPS